MTTVAVVGSRNYPDLSRVNRLVMNFPGEALKFVSGGARGVDTEAKKAAERRGVEFEEIPADWTRFGRRAGMMRNSTIVLKADLVIAFWDGKSKGTYDTFKKATAAQIPALICNALGGWSSNEYGRSLLSAAAWAEVREWQ